MRYISRFSWIALGVFLIIGQAFAAPMATMPSDYVANEVLVVPTTGVSVAMNLAEMSGLQVKGAHLGATPFLRLKLKPGQTVMQAMNSLSNQPWVARVQPNYIRHATALPNDPRFAEYWGLNNTGQTVNGVTGLAGADISAVKAWGEATDCSAIVVAVIDTGVDYNHPDLGANIWSNAGEIPANGIDDDANGFIDDVRGWDFVQGDNDPMDFNEHGTHVSGTISAVGNNATGGTGVCWNVKIMPLRALNSVGSGTTADIVAAIDYARLNGAKIINMSLGSYGGSPGDLEDMAIANANAAGVLVVAAAGNDANDNDLQPHYPSSYPEPNIIAVAATTQRDALASFSNFGATSVDVAAPGTNILSSIPPARTPVCSWNFDTGTLQGWTVQTLDNLGNPVFNTVSVTTEDAYSAPWSLTDSPGTVYANNRSYRATSPICNLSGQQGSVFSFRMNLDTELRFD
ncbi:MAG: hypothetical protein D6698_05940 [Gammaproteobacteria bacterium]|nr:MAG: hypothetical protein D6698_05940 [Gammaproteobacteria bacterium]